MKKLMTLASVFLLPLAFPFSAHSANEWGIEGEEKARFDAKVVDILCELTGNCPADCGGGKRQLGLLKEDGTLVLVAKNFDPFAGGTDDLLPHCGKKITADGLMITTKHMPVFAVQFTRPEGGKWKRSNAFGQNWSQANGGAKAGQWFRQDATVKRLIEQDGVFGIPGLKPEEE